MARKSKEELLGERFGRLLVIAVSRKHNGFVYYDCQCDCGNIKDIRKDALLTGATRSCGCLHKDAMSSRRIDMVGKQFGRLTVLKMSEHRGGNGRDIYWTCQCSCEDETIFDVLGTALRRNNKPTLSCGCIAREVNTKHGLSRTRIYKIWDNMKYRCLNSNCSFYNFYGGRGIKICDEWLDEENGFINFYNWSMKNGYNDNLTIDRINNDGNYKPDNCRWATQKEQMNNRSDNNFITINGRTQTVTQWGEETGIGDNVIFGRIRMGWKDRDLIKPLKVMSEGGWSDDKKN